MTLSLEQVVTNAWLNDCVSYIIIAAVGYDYTLTLTKEIEYVWSKPWTWMSTLYFLARYSGMCSVTLNALKVNSAIHRTTEFRTYRCNLSFIVGTWCFWIFMCSADLIMILRLWALYARSKLILGTLLTLYAIEVIVFFAYYVTLDAQFPRGPAIGITQVLGYTTCVWNKFSLVWAYSQGIAQLTLGAWMCLLIIIQYIKELVQTYKVTRRFGLGPYQKLLVWEGLVYFIAVIGFGLHCLLADAGLTPANAWQVPTAAVQQTLPFTLIPRFVLSLRELYAHDLQDRRGSNIDTAFDLGSWSGLGASSSIRFADATQDEGE